MGRPFSAVGSDLLYVARSACGPRSRIVRRAIGSGNAFNLRPTARSAESTTSGSSRISPQRRSTIFATFSAWWHRQRWLLQRSRPEPLARDAEPLCAPWRSRSRCFSWARRWIMYGCIWCIRCSDVFDGDLARQGVLRGLAALENIPAGSEAPPSITSCPRPLAPERIPSARAGRVSGCLVAGSRPRSVLAPRHRPTRWRWARWRAGRRRWRARGPRPP